MLRVLLQLVRPSIRTRNPVPKLSFFSGLFQISILNLKNTDLIAQKEVRKTSSKTTDAFLSTNLLAQILFSKNTPQLTPTGASRRPSKKSICQGPRLGPRNACGISPADNSVYCITRDGNIDPDFFVRISCDLSNWEQGDPPVDGFLCWFGPVNSALGRGGGGRSGRSGRRCEDFRYRF